MGKPAIRVPETGETVQESAAGPGLRPVRVHRDIAVEVRHGARRYLVLTDARGLVHAQEILPNHALGDPIEEDEFHALHLAFPWGA